MSPYSRFVVWAKLLLPILALMMLASLFLLQKDPDAAVGLAFSDADRALLDDGLAVVAPRIAGRSASGAGYVLLAQKAVPRTTEARDIDFTQVFLDADGIELRAPHAQLDIAAQRLTLDHGAEVATRNGARLTASVAMADLATQEVVFSGPVEFDGPDGQIAAGAARIWKEGQNMQVEFTGGVQARLTPMTP